MVEDRRTGARCAVKRIDLRQLSERKRGQALAEAGHLRCLVHPCICGFYGSFVEAQVCAGREGGRRLARLVRPRAPGRGRSS
jgi:hypothetical protein